MDDLTRSTDHREFKMTDRVIEWFWAWRSGPAERKLHLLQFLTSTSRVPINNGFKNLQSSDGPRRSTIEKSGNPNRLPRSHAPLNRLDMLLYENPLCDRVRFF